MRRPLVIAFLIATGLTAAAARAQCLNDQITRVVAGNECLVLHTFPSSDVGPAPRLLVYIHGDQSDGGPVRHMIDIARGHDQSNAVAVALLRPGYRDRDGNRSTGETYGYRDGYTAAYIDAVAGAIAALKERYRPSRSVIIGHSGGAAYAGVLIGRHSGIVDGALLLSCPCNVMRWRRDWTRSQSPQDYAFNVSPKTSVIALTGANDTNTWGALGEAYAGVLSRRGLKAEYRTVPGADHNAILRTAIVNPAIRELLGD
jgi:poly(3-hydroxybutyrate) depolymerase